jgi:hypothetical protein
MKMTTVDGWLFISLSYVVLWLFNLLSYVVGLNELNPKIRRDRSELVLLGSYNPAKYFYKGAGKKFHVNSRTCIKVLCRVLAPQQNHF